MRDKSYGAKNIGKRSWSALRTKPAQTPNLHENIRGPAYGQGGAWPKHYAVYAGTSSLMGCPGPGGSAGDSTFEMLESPSARLVDAESRNTDRPQRNGEVMKFGTVPVNGDTGIARET